jgi:DNA replication protein DnaC
LWSLKVKTERLVKESGLPNYGYSIDGYRGTKSLKSVLSIRKIIDRWQDEEKYRTAFYYAHGPNGCQKTVIADWMGRELCKKGVVVKFVPVHELTTNLRKSFLNDEDVQGQLEKYQDADMLILDEMFDTLKASVTDWLLPFLDAFLRQRVEYLQKAVFTISNVAPPDISPKFGESLKSFVLRHTRGSTLEFLDDYWANINEDVSVIYDEKGLFD